VQDNSNLRRRGGRVAAVAVGLTLAAAGITAVAGGFRAFAASSAAVAPYAKPLVVAQEDLGGEEKPVAPADVEKYINVYKAMQRNHSLTVDQASAQQGLTVRQFRDLEIRIQRDGALREQVRRALRKAGEPSKSAP
jgi:hypothetical protein